MRYAIISDIHGNLEAFETALKTIKKQETDRILFLGDIVGYGPNPNECLDLLLKEADLTLGGNHDWAVVGKTDDDYFNPFAKAAVDWTGSELRNDLKDFLKRTRPMDSYDGFQVAHSSPMSPDLWQYILSQKDAMLNYPFIENEVCFIGHSHQPLVIEYADVNSIQATRPAMVTLYPEKKYIINVGSIGQPRDSDPRSCWVIYDTEMGTVEFHRQEYDIQAVQKKMMAIGLPKYLIERLAVGR